jgi:Alg9-like mannosyltransferase family
MSTRISRNQNRTGRTLLSVLAVTLDLLIIATATVLVVTLSGHGSRVAIGRLSVSATSARNPWAIALFALVARSALTDVPFLGIGALPLSSLPGRALVWWRLQRQRLVHLTARRASRIVAIIMCASFVMKVINIVLHFGFWTGDDVEIHEMTFAHMFGWHWQAWDLRSPFYPMFFIYPVQALLHWTGENDAGRLILAGRLVVAFFSVANLWLTFRVARRLFESTPIALLSVLILASNKLHTIAGSTELPRTVSSFFVLAGFNALLIPGDLVAAAIAGSLIGIGAAMRFSETIFVVPALMQAAAAKRWRHVFIVAGSFVLICVGIFGLTDELYWGQSFFSLRHIVDFTLVKRLSSRGYQPFYEYFRSIPAWGDALTVALAVVAIRRRLWILAMWTWLPVLCLSLLPHKEPRYLVPILPFLSMMAAVSLWHIIERLGTACAAGQALLRRERFAVVFLAACGAAFASEVSGFWFVRSEAAVVLAQHIAAQGPIGGIAIEQGWRMGGRLYLPAADPLVDLDPTNDPHSVERVLRAPAITWIALLDRDVRRFGYDSLVRAAGFYEVPLPAAAEGSEYRLFRRRSAQVG